MITLSLFYEGEYIGRSDDVSLHMERERFIDISTHHDPSPQFIAGQPTWTLRARHVTFQDTFIRWATSPNFVLARIEEDGRSAMEGEVLIEEMEVEHTPDRPSYNIIFRGQGALVSTDRLQNIEKADWEKWKFEKAIRELNEQRIIYTPKLIHGSNFDFITTDVRTTQGTTTTDPTDDDPSPRGFKIVP